MILHKYLKQIKEEGGFLKKPPKTRGLWSNEALSKAIDSLDDGYKMGEICKKFGIPKSIVKDHYQYGRTTSRKIGPQGVLTMQEEADLLQYLEEMVKLVCPLNTTELRAKVVEITQTKVTPFKNGMLGKSWLKWFRNRYPKLVLRVPQGLDMNRARALCPKIVEIFCSNLETLY